MNAKQQDILRKLSDWTWEIPSSYKAGMLVPGIIYLSEAMLPSVKAEHAIEQVANVAFLPGIVRCSLAMPDIHWGYGFPIGGVAAMRLSDGVISPGGVGFDINCGTRLLRTNLSVRDIKPRIKDLIDAIFRNVPSGVGSSGKLCLSRQQLSQVMQQGANWAVKQGYGTERDIEFTEEHGCLENAGTGKVSQRACERGSQQLGTLGSGNHFVEVQQVAEIYNAQAARVMGIYELGQVLVLIHTGSRGFGHQVCTDYVRLFDTVSKKQGITLPDRQLACAPVNSDEGQDYLAAMACAANFAWANRQCIAHWVRQSFQAILGIQPDELGMEQVYDVAHNMAKLEEHTVDGDKLRVCVHRKGATRAFPPQHKDIPRAYQGIGQPVIIPGDMGRYSYVATGTDRAMRETFGSTCHGAGRMQSRGEAKRSMDSRDLLHDLSSRGIVVRAGDLSSLAEEAPQAYKDVSEVVEVTHNAGISLKVLKAEPLGVIKG